MRGCTHRTHKRNNHPLKMLPSCLLLLLCLLPLGVLARPQVQPETETGAAVGGRIGTLVSDIYNDIIRSRLKNLLEGVSPSSSPSSPPPSSISSLASTLIESSDALRNRGNGGEEDPLLEVSLPKSVTPIPSELFTSLPGAWLVDNEGKEVLVKLPTESDPGETTKGSALQEEESKDSDFLTESYSIVDLFSSSSS